MTTMRKLFLALTVISLLVAGCGPATTQSSNQPLRIMWTNLPGNYIFILAQQLGLFKKHNVNVELTYAQYYSSMVTKFASSQIDGFSSQLGDVLIMSESHSFRAVLSMDSSEGADSIVATQDIKRPPDIKNKRIGVQLGRPGELFVRQMLSHYGMTVDDVVLINTAPEAVPSALGKEIDAGHTWSAYTQEVLANNGNVIFSTADTPYLFPDVLVLQEAIVQQRPEETRALVAALLEATEYWSKYPQDGNAIIAKFVGLPIQQVAPDGIRLYSKNDNKRAFTKGNDVISLYRNINITLDFMVKTGLITSFPNLDKLLDPTFLP